MEHCVVETAFTSGILLILFPKPGGMNTLDTLPVQIHLFNSVKDVVDVKECHRLQLVGRRCLCARSQGYGIYDGSYPGGRFVPIL